jgi:peptide/nickel transport system permease protein
MTHLPDHIPHNEISHTQLQELSAFRGFVSAFMESKVAMAAAILLTIIILAALFAPVIAQQNPYDLKQISILDSRLPPGSSSDGKRFILGTDEQGRDMLSAILYGLRISLAVAVASGLIALFIGTAAGLSAGYFGGTIDAVVMRMVDFQFAFPTIMLALIVVALLGPGLTNILIALVAAQWAFFARTVRGAALVEKKKEYIEAARCLRFGRWHIVFRQLLPNCIAPLLVVSTVLISAAISIEATLSFLGVGLPVTRPSLGMLIGNGFQYMMEGMYWMSVFPGLTLLITIVCINLVGDQLRDILNPHHER